MGINKQRAKKNNNTELSLKETFIFLTQRCEVNDNCTILKAGEK